VAPRKGHHRFTIPDEPDDDWRAEYAAWVDELEAVE
jgi:hypothetical protein